MNSIFKFREISKSVFGSRGFALLVLLLIVFPKAGQGQCVAGWKNNLPITQIKFFPSGPYLAVQVNAASADGCGNWFVYKYNAPGNSLETAKIFLSMLMIAQSTGQPIGIKSNAVGFSNWAVEFSDLVINKTAGSSADEN